MEIDLMALAERAGAFIRDESPNRWGLFRTEQFDALAGSWSSERCDPDDFGDFAPFMAWHDLLTGSRGNRRWLSAQFGLMNERLRQPSGFYYPFSDGSPASRPPAFSSYPQNHLDLLLGFNLMHALLGDRRYLDASLSVAGAIARCAISGRGFVYGAVAPSLRLYLPRFGYLRHKLVVSGVMIEEFSNLHHLAGDGPFLGHAKMMAAAWLGMPSFRKHGICCDQALPFLGTESGGACSLGKPNTNFCSGLLRLGEISRDPEILEAAEKSVSGIMLFMNGDGSMMSQLDSGSARPVDRTADLAQNHMAIGTLLDAHEVLGSTYCLREAERCMGFWLQLQGESGLFPSTASVSKRRDACSIDTHSDIVTMMARLHLVTGKKVYRDALMRSAKAFRLFVRPEGIFQHVKLATGKGLNYFNEIKFVGGLLKGLLSAHTALSGEARIGRPLLRQLMRDR